MTRILNEYITSFQNEVEFRTHLADDSFTSISNESLIVDNQYHYKQNGYIVMQSDGTKRCGFYVDLTDKILHGDYVETSLEIRSIAGDKPFLAYEEWSGATIHQFNKISVESTEQFEPMYSKTYIPNIFGNRKGRVFVGLDIGQTGKFMFRFPVIKHHAQNKYTPTSRRFNSVLEHRNDTAKSHGVKIKTNIPMGSFARVTLKIQGYSYNYDPGVFVDIKLTFFASTDFFGVGLSKIGNSIEPQIKLGVEDGLVVIFIDDKKAEFFICIDAIDSSTTTQSGYYYGWTTADELINDDATNVKTLAYI